MLRVVSSCHENVRRVRCHRESRLEPRALTRLPLGTVFLSRLCRSTTPFRKTFGPDDTYRDARRQSPVDSVLRYVPQPWIPPGRMLFIRLFENERG